MRNGNRLLVIALVALCFAPFVHLVWFAFQFFVDAPRSDQWGLVVLIEAHLNGELSFQDLWEQKNVHRIFFPKLVIFSLAKATHWNHAFEIAVILVCGLTSYLVIGWQLLASYGADARHKSVFWFNAAALSLLFFSLSQYKNWLWGMQIQLMLCLVAGIAGLCILSQRLSAPRLVAALALGFVATHSFANGLAYWVVAIFPICLAPAADREARKKWLAVWIAFAALAVFSFFHNYSAKGDGLARILDSPLHHVLYGLAFLGNPIVPYSLPGAVLAGALGLALFGWLTWYCVRRQGRSLQVLIPFLSLALFAIGSAAITAVGRNNFPIAQALASRYITFGQLLWVANITLSCLTLSRPAPGKAFVQKASLAVLITLLLCVSVGYWKGMETGRSFSRRANDAARAIVASYPNVDPRIAKPLRKNPDLLLERLPILYENGLSLFRSPSSEER